MMIWGDRTKVHSLVSQGGNYSALDFETEENKIELNMELAPNTELEDREKCREIAFFFDSEPNIKMTIQGERATTFHLAEEFILETSQMQISIMMTLKGGEGQFIG